MEPTSFVVGLAVGIIVVLGVLSLGRLIIDNATEVPPGHPEFDQPFLGEEQPRTDRPALWFTPQRATLAFEGLETVDGRVISPGAITLPDEPVPLQIQEPSGELTTLGTASDFQRSEDGSISGVLSVTAEGLFPEIVLTRATWTRATDVATITHGTLRAVVLGDNPCWDELEALR